MPSPEQLSANRSIQPPSRPWNLFLVGMWLAYLGYLFLSDLPPGPSILQWSQTGSDGPSLTAFWQEAVDLSLNFWFIIPTLIPGRAPIINPVLEGLFNLVIAWALLFWGFLLDGRSQRWPMTPFLVGTAFLTNVFYLPWLALRQPQPHPPDLPLSRLERMAESRWLPLTLMAVVVAAVIWAAVGRPDFGDWGDRWADFTELLRGDRLAYSFICDAVFFWIFQGWLVPDDMARRGWQQPAALWTARLLPLVGLVIYLLWRPAIAPDLEDKV